MADEQKTAAPDSAPVSAASLLEDAPKDVTKIRRKKSKRSVPKARACVHCGENNTIVTITDLQGNTLAWASSGSSGFAGTRKSTPYSAKVAAENAATKAAGYGVESVTVEIKGIGPGREQSLRGLQAAGLNLDAIVDVTPIPHGGCRPPRRRRV